MSSLLCAFWRSRSTPGTGVNMLLTGVSFSFPIPSSLMTDSLDHSDRGESCVLSGPNNLALALGHHLLIYSPQS